MQKAVGAATLGFLMSLVAAAPALAASDFSVGSRVQVAAGPLRARDAASIEAAIYGSQQTGAQGVVFQGPVEKDGYTWWFINYDTGVDGWTAGSFLENAQSAQVAAAAISGDQLQALYWELKNILVVLQQLAAAKAQQQ